LAILENRLLFRIFTAASEMAFSWMFEGWHETSRGCLVDDVSISTKTCRHGASIAEMVEECWKQHWKSDVIVAAEEVKPSSSTLCGLPRRTAMWILSMPLHQHTFYFRKAGGGGRANCSILFGSGGSSALNADQCCMHEHRTAPHCQLWKTVYS
jgi:hypothetical protein